MFTIRLLNLSWLSLTKNSLTKMILQCQERTVWFHPPNDLTYFSLWAWLVISDIHLFLFHRPIFCCHMSLETLTSEMTTLVPESKCWRFIKCVSNGSFFFMLLPRVLVPSWKKYNLGKESSLGGWLDSQEYLFSGIGKHIGSVGEAVGWMTGLFYIND